MAWYEHGTSRIYYEEEGSGDPLLLLPGWSMSIDDLAPVRQALVPRYHVIAVDAPGAGKSGPQPRKYTASYFQDDARAFLGLIRDLRAKPAHVVGFSDGGEYALVMAELEPAAVRSIAAWGAAGRLAVPVEMVDAFSQVIDNPIPPLKEFSAYLTASYGRDNARSMTQSWTGAMKEMIKAGGDISRQRAGEITCPALLITGENDGMFAPPSVVSDMAAAMPNAEFVLAKGAGHLVHHDTPDWLITTIVDWLAKR